MRSSRFLLAGASLLVAAEAAAQSAPNVLVVPPANGVVIPPRSAAPRLTARRGWRGNGSGARPRRRWRRSAAELVALILPGLAAPSSRAGQGAVAGPGGRGAAPSPARAGRTR
jgi:hypothetical protein